MPSSTVVVFSRGCLPASGGCCDEPSDQSPSCCRSSSALGPTTAMDFTFAGSSGSRPLFWRSTRLWRAAARLTARWSGRATSTAARSRSGRRGILEETHAELQRQQAGAGRVDLRLGQAAAAHGLDGALVELRGGHHDVVAGAQRHDRGIGVGRRRPSALVTRRPTLSQSVTTHAAEAPLVLEDVGEQPAVGGRGHAVHRLVAGHEGHRAGAGGALERRQEVAAQLAAREVGLGGVAAALRLGVAGIVLGGGEHGRRVVEALALVAADQRGAELADQIRILAERFAGAAPAQVARQAEHGRERPVDARRRHLLGGHAADLSRAARDSSSRRAPAGSGRWSRPSRTSGRGCRPRRRAAGCRGGSARPGPWRGRSSPRGCGGWSRADGC